MTHADPRRDDGRDALNTAQTARDLVIAGAAWFEAAGIGFHHGTDNALDEAAALVLHALGLGYDAPESAYDRLLDDAERTRAVDLLKARVATRKPAAYLTRETWFAGLSFYVDERVLVPRSPLAELVEAEFTPWVDPGRVRRILDLCTGSGCIGIACALYLPRAEVTLADLSDEALAVARINVKRHGLEQRIRLVRSDVYDALAGRCYDIIVSNPPYVPRTEFEGLGPEFAHEPALGLVAGADGLDIVVRILRDAADHLGTGGILVVEVGNTRDILVEQFPEVPFLWLDFARGGEGVFLLEREQLLQHQASFERAAEGGRNSN
jgi:ribosomal protein L3 glutamine methyltransferase